MIALSISQHTLDTHTLQGFTSHAPSLCGCMHELSLSGIPEQSQSKEVQQFRLGMPLCFESSPSGPVTLDRATL
eukprot:249042-Chlamydomonas_euryale.AAC.1